MKDNLFFIFCLIFTGICAVKEICLLIHNNKFSNFKIEFIKLCIAFREEKNVVYALDDIYESLIRKIVPSEDQKHLDVNIKYYSSEEKREHCLENIKWLAKKYRCWDEISN